MGSLASGVSSGGRGTLRVCVCVSDCVGFLCHFEDEAQREEVPKSGTMCLHSLPILFLCPSLSAQTLKPLHGGWRERARGGRQRWQASQEDQGRAHCPLSFDRKPGVSPQGPMKSQGRASHVYPVTRPAVQEKGDVIHLHTGSAIHAHSLTWRVQSFQADTV